MLLAHISDSHLGASPYGLIERERDFYEAFSEAVDTAIKDHVDALVHSGDIFDAPRPQGQALHELLNGLKRLSEAGIKVFFTLGEHDISRVADRPAALIFSSIGLAEYVGDGEPHEHLGYTFIGHYKHRRTEIQLLLDKFRKDEAKLNGRKGVLIIHQGLREVHSYAGEISEADLPKGFMYYALGHIHDRAERRLLNGAVAAYPGSLEATAVEGINESEKGFFIVDLSGGEPQLHWIKLSSVRPRLRYSLSYEELRRAADEIISRASSMPKKPLIRIEVKVKQPEEEMARAIIGKIASAALYCEPEIVNASAPSPVAISRPADVGDELRRLAAQVLRDEEAANVALDELLPLLSAGDVKGAADLMWGLYLKALKGEAANDRER